MPRAVYIAAPEKSANLAAGDGNAAYLLLRIDDYLKSEFLSELCKALDIALCLVPKVEIGALMDLACLESLTQNLASKLARRSGGKIAAEGQHKRGVQAGLLQQLELLGQRCDQFGRNIGAQDARRMRLKRNSNRFRPPNFRPRDHFPQDALMGEMHSVKVAGGHNRAAKIGRHLREIAKNAHGFSKSQTPASGRHKRALRWAAERRWFPHVPNREICG